MLTERFLKNRRGVSLTDLERGKLEAAIADVRVVEPRTTVVYSGDQIRESRLLVDGLMSRYIDDRRGLRQLVGVHVPGEFIDLHAYPMQVLDHNVGALTEARIAIVPHHALDALIADDPELKRKLWFSTLIDAAMHRVWLFRVGRLDGVGRVAHFLCEMNARLEMIGLSNGTQFALELTQTDLGDVCGLTAIHTNRVLRQLREADLCMFRNHTVDIFDRVALERRANFDRDYLYLAETQVASPTRF